MERKETAYLAAVGLISAASLLYVLAPTETQGVARKAATAVDDMISSDKTTEPARTCTDIEQIPLSTKIGAVILPMAEATRLDELEQTMISQSVSNFTILGHPGDVVTYHGVPTNFSEATNGIILATSTANSVATTFALDEEGGIVQRVDNLENGAHVLPSAQEMALKTPEEIKEMFRVHGEYLASLGVTTVFGPVTDVGTKHADGSRSFSDDPVVVARSAKAVIEGLRAAGIQATAKHLPDYGQSPSNSDNEATSVPSIQQLEQYSIWYIAQVLQEAQPTYGMVGNYFIPGLSDTIPASLNPAVYEYIHNAMGFTGVFITDALDAGAIENYTGLDPIASQAESTVRAINAGADVVIIHLNATTSVVAFLNQSLASGTMTLDTIDRAAAQALGAKGYDICNVAE